MSHDVVQFTFHLIGWGGGESDRIDFMLLSLNVSRKWRRIPENETLYIYYVESKKNITFFCRLHLLF